MARLYYYRLVLGRPLFNLKLLLVKFIRCTTVGSWIHRKIKTKSSRSLNLFLIIFISVLIILTVLCLITVEQDNSWDDVDFEDEEDDVITQQPETPTPFFETLPPRSEIKGKKWAHVKQEKKMSRETEFKPKVDQPLIDYYNKFGRPGKNGREEFDNLTQNLDKDGGPKIAAEIARRHVANWDKIADSYLDTAQSDRFSFQETLQKNLPINIGAAVCGEKSETLREVKVLFKSLVTFGWDAMLNVILFVDEAAFSHLMPWLLDFKWSLAGVHPGFSYELHLASFPLDNKSDFHADPTWRNMGGCATQWLFFPSLLPDVDALLYLDTDVIVTSNLTSFWLRFGKFNPNQALGIVLHEGSNNNSTTDPWGIWNTSRLNGTGVNSGIMLMNLTRLRSINLESRIVQAYYEYSDRTIYADQDLIKFVFRNHQEQVYYEDCSYNLVPEICKQKWCPSSQNCKCKGLNKFGAFFVHGIRGSFLRNLSQPLNGQDKPPAGEDLSVYQMVQSLFKSFEQFNVVHGSKQKLVKELIQNYNDLNSPCRDLPGHILYQQAKEYVHNLETFS